MAGPFDLERFAPNPYFEFKLRTDGETYRCLADPDVDQVARMLRIEETIHAPESSEAMAAAMIEGKQVLVELIQEAEPGRDLSAFKAGGRQILAIFGGIMYGTDVAAARLTWGEDDEPESGTHHVAQAVKDGIGITTPDAPPQDGSGAPGGLQHGENDGYSAVGGDDAAPLPLAKLSSVPSSTSDEPAGTSLATGTG